MHKYKLKYKLDMDAGEFSKEDLTNDPSDVGGTDALILFSLLYPEDGSFSSLMITKDGRSGEVTELDDNEVFKVWSMLAHRLAESKTLSKNKKEFASQVFEIHREAVLGSKCDKN